MKLKFKLKSEYAEFNTDVHLFCFWSDIPFLSKFSTKNENCQCKLKFSTQIKSNLQNSTVMFIFSVFDHKYPFPANLVQKIKIVSLSWNLIARLISICRIQWWCSFCLFWTGNTILGNLFQKIKIVYWS